MVPSVSDVRWRGLVENPGGHCYHFLALQIFMQRIARKSASLTPAVRDEFVAELHAFFCKNERLLGKDIAAIFGRE